MKEIAEKYSGILVLYLFLACWTPVFWFVSSAMNRHNMHQFDFSDLNFFEMILGLIIFVGSFLSQFLLFHIKFDKNRE
jgi:hypothetical protein